jgi:hypothetical protein
MTEETIIHKNVAAALVAITDDLPGIEKKKHGGGVPYAFRGIEDITKALQPLLVKHGIVITPAASVVSVEPLPSKGTKGDWTRTTLSVTYTIRLRDSTDWADATTIGVGDDNGDKGANKAMSQAFKYLLLQTFCISDPADDGDGIPADPSATPEVAEPEPEAPEGWDTAKASATAHTALSERVSHLTDENRAVCSEWRKVNPGWPLTKDKFDELSSIVTLIEAEMVAPEIEDGDGF